MARTLTEIYNEAKKSREENLQLTEIKNSSKMSVIDAFTWVTSACIWSFENIMDVFKVDISRDIQNRINGTPSYYANALLKFQYGDQLTMNDDGTQFSYSTVDESKRIISKVAYSEFAEEGFHDKALLLKVAKGTPGEYQQLSDEELIAARAYLRNICFAGTHFHLASRKGDVLIPRLTVYYDGLVTEDEVYNNIERRLNEYIANFNFNGVVYVQRIVDAIQLAEHVVDVYISDEETDRQGIFVAQYNDDNNLIPQNSSGDFVSYEEKISRYFIPNSGYLRESSGTGDEKVLPKWRSSILLKVEEV